MTHTIQGQLSAQGMTFGIVLSRFNDYVGDKLLAGAVDALTRSGARSEDIDVVRTPGAFEIPLALKKMAQSKRYSALIALGVVVRGETPHFDYVAGEVSRGVAKISLEHDTPIGFGVVTTDTMEQAIDRAGGKAGNKGHDAAIAAIEMASLLKQLKA
jgi:6,7-dimethyl-8-ribityllumazine synthase